MKSSQHRKFGGQLVARQALRGVEETAVLSTDEPSHCLEAIHSCVEELSTTVEALVLTEQAIGTLRTTTPSDETRAALESIFSEYRQTDSPAIEDHGESVKHGLWQRILAIVARFRAWLRKLGDAMVAWFARLRAVINRMKLEAARQFGSNMANKSLKVHVPAEVASRLIYAPNGTVVLVDVAASMWWNRQVTASQLWDKETLKPLSGLWIRISDHYENRPDDSDMVSQHDGDQWSPDYVRRWLEPLAKIWTDSSHNYGHVKVTRTAQTHFTGKRFASDLSQLNHSLKEHVDRPEKSAEALDLEIGFKDAYNLFASIERMSHAAAQDEQVWQSMKTLTDEIEHFAQTHSSARASDFSYQTLGVFLNLVTRFAHAIQRDSTDYAKVLTAYVSLYQHVMDRAKIVDSTDARTERDRK